MDILDQMNTLAMRSSGDRLHQTDARSYKNLLHAYLTEALQEVDVTPVDNGLILEIPHEEYGAIVVELKAIIKPFNYDVEEAADNYQTKLEARAARQTKESE